MDSRIPSVLTPDERHIVIAPGKYIYLVDLKTGKGNVIVLKNGDNSRANTLCVSPDSRICSIGFADGRVRIFSMPKVD